MGNLCKPSRSREHSQDCDCVVPQVYPGGSEALHERGERWLHVGGRQAAAGAGEGAGPGGGGRLPRAVRLQHAETHPLPRAQDPVIL